MTEDKAKTYLDLIEQYRAKFGDAPPIFWADPPDKIPWHVEQMKKALETGEPWRRPELEDVPEGVLI
jgi:hypothetical protein